MKFTEAEVANRMNKINTIEDIELRECAFNFWCMVMTFMKSTNSRVLTFEIERDVNDGPYGAVIRMTTRYGMTSTAQLCEYAPETIEYFNISQGA